MKKVVLILFIAFMASITTTWAQAPNLTGIPSCPTPIAVTCLSADALHPVPGTEYLYEIDVPTPPGTKYYTWLVTQDQTFISNSNLVATAELDDGSGDHIQATGGGYYDPTTGQDTISITWKSWTHDPNNPVFLVIYVQNEDACTTDNIQVYIIEPMHAFTLDILNMDMAGDTMLNNYTTCVDSVSSASYNVTSGEVEMDFGVNYMFFAVTAANFTDSWMPSFQIDGTGLHDSRAITAIEWAYPGDAQTGPWTAVPVGASAPLSIWQGDVAVMASGGSGVTVGAEGECIIIRMTIENNQVQTIVDESISLAVNGIMLDPNVPGDYTNGVYADIHWTDDGSGTCPWYDDYVNDVVTQILSARPDIQAINPTPFVNTNAE